MQNLSCQKLRLITLYEGNMTNGLPFFCWETHTESAEKREMSAFLAEPFTVGMRGRGAAFLCEGRSYEKHKLLP